jgi:hypothetical protein
METIAAIVILSIAIPPMLWSIREAHVQRANPVLLSRARWLAVEKLETVIADRHSTTRGYTHLVAGNYPAENPVSGMAGYQRSVTFNETTADLSTAGSGYMTVEVSVTYDDAEGTSQTFVVATVLTEYTP